MCKFHKHQRVKDKLEYQTMQERKQRERERYED
jgi:hypothetical protein